MVMKMKKKFRELRMFCLCMIMFIVFMIAAIYFGIHHLKPQMIGALLLSMIALSLVLLRYKMIIYDDMMIIYEWKVAAMLPTMIEYKNIQSIERKSKHHVVITHLHKSHVYVFNSDQFIDAYQNMKKI